MNLVQLTDEHMTRSGLRFPRGQYMYPSEASIKFIDQQQIKLKNGEIIIPMEYIRDIDSYQIPVNYL